MEELFNLTISKPQRTRTRRANPSTRGWRDLLPMRKTTLGMPYTDPERAERMRVALVGVHMDRQSEHLMDLLVRELAEDRMAMRVCPLREHAPDRVTGFEHLSCRAQQAVRATIARGEDRGYHAYLPFTACMHKELPDGPIQHGALLFDDRGLDLGLVSGATHRAAANEWPLMEQRGWVPGASQHGCPLVVGDSDARSSWSHLAELGALAVWPARSNLLYVFKMRPEHHFPDIFTLVDLRRRAAGEGL